MPDTLFFHIKTIGCQMNSYDAQVYRDYLQALGLQESSNIREADLVIVNTCAVRQKSVDKARNLALQLSYLKRKKKLALCLTGCASTLEDFAQLKAEGHIDYAHGPLNAMQVPEAFINFVKSFLTIETLDENVSILPDINGFSAQVPVIHGCNSFCSYCIVPLVRGRELSVPLELLLQKVSEGCTKGIKEWTLLGQNVNHYGLDLDPQVSFSDLLDAVASIQGVLRLDFITSHPKEFDLSVLDIMKKHSNIYQHFHLPVQSGDNEILKRMKRGYTVEHYQHIIDQIRRYFPLASLTTDIIVGFPGENDSSFSNTVKLVEKIGFDTVYAAVYSHRPGTLSSTFPDILDEDLSKERLNHLLEVQRKSSHERIKRFVDADNEVFITKKISQNTYLAKTIEEKTILLSSTEELEPGSISWARIHSIEDGQLKGIVK